MPIEIAGISLSRIHKIATLEVADFVRHRVPGLEGDLVQDMGRGSVRLEIEGIFYGEESSPQLEELREVYKSREAVDFLAEITGEAYFAQVILEQLEVLQRSQEPEQFSYRLVVAEYVEPPEPASPGFSLVDAAILDDALSFADALELPALLDLPEFSNPLEPMSGLVDGAETAIGPVAENQDLFTSPNVFDSLDTDLQNPALDSQLSDQSQAFSGITTASDSLQADAPAEVGQLIQSLDSQQIPSPEIPTVYTDSLTNLNAAVPSDISSLSAPLDSPLQDLSDKVITDISGQLSPMVDGFHAAKELVTLTGIEISVSAPSVASRSLMAGMSGMGPGDEFVSTINGVIAFLENSGTVLSVESFLDAVRAMLREMPRELLQLPKVPYIDELTQVLDTAQSWRNATGPEIADQLEKTLLLGSTYVRKQLDELFSLSASPLLPFSAATASFGIGSSIEFLPARDACADRSHSDQ